MFSSSGVKRWKVPTKLGSTPISGRN